MRTSTLADRTRAVVALDRAEDAEAARDALSRADALTLPAPIFEAVSEANAALRYAGQQMPREWFAVLARSRWARVMGGA